MTHNWSPTSIGRNTFERSVSPRTSGIPQTGQDTKPETALFFRGGFLRKTKVLKYESAAIMMITAMPISTYSIFSFVMNAETGDATTEAPYKRALSSQRMQSRKKTRVRSALHFIPCAYRLSKTNAAVFQSSRKTCAIIL